MLTRRQRGPVAAAAAVLTLTNALAAAAPSLPHGYVYDPVLKAPARLAFTEPEVEALADTGIRLFPSTVDRYRPWTEGYAPPGEVFETTSGAPNVIDDRYFDATARATLWSCVQEAYPAAASEGPAAVDGLVARCMATVWQRVGDPCLKPSRVPELCTDLGYHTSWCGRKDRPTSFTKQWACFAPLEDAAASIAEPIDEIAIPPVTYDEHQAETRHVHETARGVRIYDRDDYYEWDAYIPFESTAFAALRGVAPPPPASAGITPPLGSTVGAVTWSVIPPGIDLAIKSSYGLNGTAVATCAEYAVEKHLEFALLDDWERQQSRTPHEIYRAIYETAEAGGPFVTAAGDFDFRARGGGLACAGTAATCDFDPAAAVATGAAREPLFGVGVRTTYQNAYAFARQILAIDANTALTVEQRRVQRGGPAGHYTVDDRWHKRMGRALAAYHPDLLEDLRVQQRAIWDLVITYEARRDYLDTLRGSPMCVSGWRPSGVFQFCTTPQKEATAATDLAAARATLTAAIADEALYCPVTGSAGETPCDWAPSRAVDSVHAHFERQMLNDYHRCVDHHGEGPLVEAELERPYLHPGIFEPTPPTAARYPVGTSTTCPLNLTWTPTALNPQQAQACAASCPIDGTTATPTVTTGPDTAACRALFLATNPLATPQALEALWRDQPRYVDLLSLSLHESYDGVKLTHAANYEKTIGNSTFGLAAAFASDGGKSDSYRRHLCDEQPYSNDDSVVDVAIFGTSYEVMKKALATNPTDAQVTHISSGPTWSANAGWDCASEHNCPVEADMLEEDIGTAIRNTKVGANFISSDTQQGAQVTFAAPPAQISIGVVAKAYLTFGPFMVYMSAGASGAVGAGLDGSVTAMASRSPSAGCRGFEFATSFGATGFANVGANVAVGISIGVPGFSVDAGVRGRLSLIDSSLGAAVQVQARAGHNYEGEPTGKARLAFEVHANGHVFSGSLSLVIEMTLAFLTIPLYEVVLVQWKGPGVNYQGQVSVGTDGLDSEGGAWVDECLLNSLQTLWGQIDRKTNGCPCYPWDDAADGAACGAP